jgi:hypothetical protein
VTAPPAVTSAPLVKAQHPIAAPTDASAPDDSKRAAGGGESTNSSGMLIMGLIVLVFGLALVGLMRRVARKDAAARRARISPDQSWYNPYEDPEFYRKLRQGLRA